MNPKKTQNTNLEANLVVIGSGGGGLAAAAAAVEKGITNIIVLEKLKMLGGNSGHDTGPHAIFAVESPVQKRENINATKDDFFKQAIEWAHWKTNPKIVRAFIDKSGDTIKWLENKGLEFEVLPYPPIPVAVRHLPKGLFGTSGSTIINVLAKECKKFGVQIFTNTPAKKILTDSNGRISGVLAGTRGKQFTINTKNVVIATGGFGGNKKLLKEYCVDYRDDMELAEAIPNQGDGLLMAMAVGAANEGLGTLHIMGPLSNSAIFVAVEGHSKKIPVILQAIVLQPTNLWVNKRGERFADETIGKYHFTSCNVAVQQPDNVTYSLFDSQTVKNLAEQGFPKFVGEDVKGKKIMGLEEALRALMDKAFSADGLGNEIPNPRGPWVKISNSWDEIANWIGADPKTLKATVSQHNTAYDNGHDPLFAKERKYLVPLRTPPYYAIRSHVMYAGTLGGIKINERMEVIDKQGNPIPGLYAAGVDTGGWESSSYCPLMPGSSFSFALNSGRIAGENVADKIKGK